MNNGYISLHRKILNWEWYKDLNTKCVFIHLLLVANHKDNKWMGINIPRGSLITSIKHLSESNGISTMSIRTSLARLKSTNEITIKTTNKYSLITIKNYNSYQQLTSKLTNEQQTTNKQLTTNNNDNNDNNDNKKNKRVKYKNSSNDLGEEVDKVSKETISIKNLKLYMSKSYPTRESYINDTILNHLVGLYNKAEKTPYNKSAWLRDVELIELFPLGLEVGIKTEDLQKFANSLYEKYSSGYTLKDKRKIKNFKQFFCGIVRRDQVKFRKQFGEILTWNIPY